VVLLVEQNTRLALTLANKVYALENGEVGFSGTAEEARGSSLIQDLYLGAREKTPSENRHAVEAV